MNTSIRACLEEEIETLREIAHETYNETFGALNTAETMEEYLAEAFSTEKLLGEQRTPGSRFFLMHLDKTVVGYLKTNEAPAQSDLNDPEGLEIERIYIRKVYERKGYGERLMKFALEQAADLQKEYVWLGVWEKNVGAISFYEKLGFEKAGTHAFRMGDEVQLDYIMKKPIRNQSLPQAPHRKTNDNGNSGRA